MRVTGLVAAFALLGAPALAQQPDLRELARTAKESVVRIRIFDAAGGEAGTGSGFFIASDRIVSNHHVVSGAHSAKVDLADGSSIDVLGVYADDPKNDLVVLKVPPSANPPLPLASGEAVQPGQRIIVLGSPLGLAGTLTEGIVSAVRDDGLEEPGSRSGRTAPVLQISAPISPGSSGSPVMNLDGQVIGVAVSQFVYGQNLNFAVPMAPLVDIIGRAAKGELVETYRKTKGGEMSSLGYIRNLVISLAFFAVVYRLVIGPAAFRRLRRS